MVDRLSSQAMNSVLRRLAPGTDLRDGLERILRGRTGALIVLGFDRSVEEICDGGFQINIDFSPTRLRELSKMDGAVILNDNATRILRANVQLMPDPSIATVESGTRHRTAERVALQTKLPVISVSHSMSIISLYFDGVRYVVPDPTAILGRANQALATLQRYRHRLDEVAQSLSALEIEDFTTVRDVMTVLQRLMMVRRIAGEISNDIVELGTEGRLTALQLDELTRSIEESRALLVRDYVPGGQDRSVPEIMFTLEQIDETSMLDLNVLAREMGFPFSPDLLEQHVSARGYRLLATIPRVPSLIQDRLVAHFHNLQGLLAATAGDLQAVDGVGEARARVVREGLSRVAETSIVDRFGSSL